MGKHTKPLKKITSNLCDALDGLRFSEPVTHVYNPLVYARRPHDAFLERCGNAPLKVLFLGMNPGPYGMAQTGVPFGEVHAVRDWIGINESVDQPPNPHPKRPVQGFQCTRSEVSGRRLWGLFTERFKKTAAFFDQCFVVNYCPLVFMEESGRNRTPDKIPKREMEPVYAACDTYVRALVDLLKPEWAVGIGGFAEGCLRRNIESPATQIGRILHPSPASPAANRGWAETSTKEMEAMGIW